jgi:hypothetical protein
MGAPISKASDSAKQKAETHKKGGLLMDGGASTHDKLVKRIVVLNDRVWEQRVPKSKIDAWLENFTGRVAEVETERLHALFWLSQFMYFGNREIRVLLRSVFRDLFLCPMIQDVRAKLASNATDRELELAVIEELSLTRFLGVGNPSESGVHLLYYFRQENQLSKQHFMDSVQIFRRGQAGDAQHKRLRNTKIRRYVFLDDICGSGETAADYSKEILTDLLQENGAAKVAYYSLFATTEGLQNIRQKTLFANDCAAVYELDASYRCLSESSRYFKTKDYEGIDKEVACKMVKEYGALLNPNFANGYKDSQMLMGFHHNTPDNTIGIIWHDSAIDGGSKWTPIFKRYPKFSKDSL